LDSVGIHLLLLVDSSPPHSLVVVVVGVVEVRDDPNQVPEGRVHKDHYIHSWSAARIILLDMLWCSYLEGFSTGEWWTNFG